MASTSGRADGCTNCLRRRSARFKIAALTPLKMMRRRPVSICLEPDGPVMTVKSFAGISTPILQVSVPARAAR